MKQDTNKSSRPYALTCRRCGHQWRAFIEVPKECGNRKCRSRYWNHPDAVLGEIRARLHPASEEQKAEARKRAVDKRRESGRGVEATKRWREAHSEERAAYKREYNTRPEVQERRRENQNAAWQAKPKMTRQVIQRRNLIRRYGMQPDEFDTMLAAQEGKCKICENALAPVGTKVGLDRPHIDHDHVDGHTRGILCGRCNTGLGMFGDYPDRIRAAAQYLEENAADRYELAAVIAA